MDNFKTNYKPVSCDCVYPIVCSRCVTEENYRSQQFVEIETTLKGKRKYFWVSSYTVSDGKSIPVVFNGNNQNGPTQLRMKAFPGGEIKKINLETCAILLTHKIEVRGFVLAEFDSWHALSEFA